MSTYYDMYNGGRGGHHLLEIFAFEDNSLETMYTVHYIDINLQKKKKKQQKIAQATAIKDNQMRRFVQTKRSLG